MSGRLWDVQLDVFYVSGRVWEAQSLEFYVSGRLWEVQFIIFYVSGRLWEVQFAIFYVSGRLWEAQSLVFYVSGRFWEAQSIVFYVAWRLCEAHLYVFACPGSSGEGQILTALRYRVGPLKETLDSGDSEGSIYRILCVLEALRGSFVRIYVSGRLRGGTHSYHPKASGGSA